MKQPETKFAYSGVGSRSTPLALEPKIRRIAEILDEKGYVLRSGGAQGADIFFESGAKNKEIYLPCKNFNNSDSLLYNQSQAAFDMAERFHPNWKGLSSFSKKLMARNSHQIFGLDMESPSKFIICWTKNGKVVGGTGQVLRIAKRYDVPVINLGKPNFDIDKFIGDLERLKSELV